MSNSNDLPKSGAPASAPQPQRTAARGSQVHPNDEQPGNIRDPLELEVPHRTTPALILSVVAHVVLLVLIGLVISTAPKGSGDSPDRPVGIALVHRLPDRDRYVEAKPEQMTEQTDSQSESSLASAAAPPADLSPPIDLAGVLQAMEATPSPVSGTGLAGETNLDANALGDGTGQSGNSADGEDSSAMVFGVSGSGSHFVYVFDRSDSMNGFGGLPLRSAKAELIRSLKTLTPKQRFQIIFYNDKPKPFQVSGMPLQLVAGESDMVSRAENYVNGIRAFGGTKHELALKLALRMSPDVIFFLTDARIPRLSGVKLAEIKRRAEQAGTTIHAIEFGGEPGAPPDSFLRDLASQNGGQYQYINVGTLGERRGRQSNERLQQP